jgi:hypothetical protein
MVANWLYGVACRTALKSRSATAKRHAREKQVMELPEPEAVVHDRRDQLIPLLDKELSRLPEKYRTPIILCDLEGKTHRDAANQLGWPIGTLSGRLSRARAMLAKRLVRQGLILPAGALGSVMADRASGSVSASVVSSTIQAAGLIVTGKAVTAGLVSARVVMLSEEVIKAMILTKLRLLAVVLVMAAATGGIAFRTQGSETAVAPGTKVETTQAVPVAQQKTETAPKPRDARSTAEAFLAALSEGKVKEAARFCWPEEYDEATLWGLKTALQGAHPSLDSVDVVGNIALALSVKMKLKSEDEPPFTRLDGVPGWNPKVDARLTLLLSKKDEDWQIQNIHLGLARRMELDRTRFITPFPDPKSARKATT